MAKQSTKKSASKASGKSTAKGQQAAGEVHAFQAEMQQLLNIIIHSLYSEREIFLRELISNASDALNRLRFNMITDTKVRDKDAALEIVLAADTEGKTLTVSDSGIGMTQQELIDHLGTIAKSGTLDFVKELSSADPSQRMDLIGQFGVGFYSVFMVAKRVVVDTCPADPSQPAWQWSSEGAGEYQLAPSQRTARGTSVRVEFKEECEEFCSPARIEQIVKKYSNFVPHPVMMEDKRLNAQDAIWIQSKSEVNEEQYQEFYKFLTHDFENPLHSIHLSIDAPVQYRAVLFIPPQLSNEVLYSPTGFGLQLYAAKVMIQNESQDLLPLYLRFFRGVVDTEDLPLNVSREMVQRNPLLAKLSSSLAGRVIRELQSLAETDPERYATFWKQYGKVLKEGITSDPANQERLLELARFNSSQFPAEDELTTLHDYVSRMREGQKEILYFNGPSREAIERNPHLEFFKKNGMEVLYLYDHVDNFIMAQLHEFEGKVFASIDQSNLEAFKEEGATPPNHEQALPEEELQEVLKYLQDTLGERVASVNASKRLVDSPACLVNPDDMPGNVQKMMRMLDKNYTGIAKILEVNPAHPLIRHMSSIHKSHRDSPLLKELAEQILDNCLLVEGLIEHPEQMVERIQSLMTQAAAMHSGAEAPAKD
ncbi:MAG: molecular chaperone HtpG [SAR324 cluster bacterium]|nr:molecular chaperone HtpG [SAR324 cluster bacterium]